MDRRGLSSHDSLMLVEFEFQGADSILLICPSFILCPRQKFLHPHHYTLAFSNRTLLTMQLPLTAYIPQPHPLFQYEVVDAKEWPQAGDM